MTEFIRTALRSSYTRFCHSQFKATEPVAINVWESIRTKHNPHNAIKDILAPVFRKKHPYSGSNPLLKDALRGLELGTWAIDSRAADRLWQYLDEKRPNTVLEFGSGTSTCVFSKWMMANNPNGTVISVDQHESEAAKTTDLLKERGLDPLTHVINMPMRPDDRYDINLSQIKELLNDRLVDILFTDGPAGRDGCRDNTFIETRDLLADNALWFLHDSLRDGEMNILREWESAGATPMGIIPFGMGLAVGTWRRKV